MTSRRDTPLDAVVEQLRLFMLDMSGSADFRFYDQVMPMVRKRADAIITGVHSETASETASITKERDEAIIKRDALHLVVSVLAGKLMLENAELIDMLKQAEGELRAKRWLS